MSKLGHKEIRLKRGLTKKVIWVDSLLEAKKFCEIEKGGGKPFEPFFSYFWHLKSKMSIEGHGL